MIALPFANLTRGSVKGRLTPRQAKRLSHLIASGPLDYKPVDDELYILGWVQSYDRTDATEAVEDAEKALYDESGRIKAELLPVEWLPNAIQVLQRAAAQAQYTNGTEMARLSLYNAIEYLNTGTIAGTRGLAGLRAFWEDSK